MFFPYFEKSIKWVSTVKLEITEPLNEWKSYFSFCCIVRRSVFLVMNFSYFLNVEIHCRFLQKTKEKRTEDENMSIHRRLKSSSRKSSRKYAFYGIFLSICGFIFGKFTYLVSLLSCYYVRALNTMKISCMRIQNSEEEGGEDVRH